MKIKTWQIITVLISLISGTILHFTYEWSGKNLVVGLFSAVNESTWEHLKLIFYPMIFMALIGYFIIGKRTNNYWFAQALGIVSAMAFTIILFYTYTGIIGTNFASINIGIFIVATILGGYITYKILKFRKNYNAEIVSIIFLLILFSSFILYTFVPPKIQLFQEPITGTYGINNLTIR